jgi:hypothetical protein
VRSPLTRTLELFAFAVVPLAALAIGLSTFSDQNRIALDFHYELYPQAHAVVNGGDAYPAPDADLSDGSNAIWPMAAVLPATPLTALSAEAADWVATALMLIAFVATLWVLEVRDWRIYGVALLWPPVIDAYQTANLTLPLALLVALVWRYRDRRFVAGLLLGLALALKFFLWPVAVWLVAAGRRTAAGVSVLVGAASLLLLVPFISIPDYVRLVRNLSDTFDGQSYTPYALLLDLGAPSAAARAVTLALGAAVLALAWRRRSLGLAIGAALVLSPIVWRHFFALLLVPLALARPRLDVAWAIPLAFWLVPGSYNGAPWQTALGLAVAALTVAVAELRTSVVGQAPLRRPHAALKPTSG